MGLLSRKGLVPSGVSVGDVSDSGDMLSASLAIDSIIMMLYLETTLVEQAQQPALTYRDWQYELQ